MFDQIVPDECGLYEAFRRSFSKDRAQLVPERQISKSSTESLVIQLIIAIIGSFKEDVQNARDGRRSFDSFPKNWLRYQLIQHKTYSL